MHSDSKCTREASPWGRLLTPCGAVQVELLSDKTLAAAGLADKATVTAVRKVLVPEGWKVSPHMFLHVLLLVCDSHLMCSVSKQVTWMMPEFRTWLQLTCAQVIQEGDEESLSSTDTEDDF